MFLKTATTRILSRITSTSPHKSQIGVRFLGGQAASPLQESVVEEEMEWENLGFGLVQTDYMYVMKCGEENEFEAGQLSRFGNIELSPSAGVLNYGQGIFEGTKAYRSENGGLFLFRPQENAIRMQIGAERMCMQSPSVHQFIHAVKQTALANRRWVLKAMRRAKDKGFSDVLYLDANNKRDIEEVSSSNVFMLKVFITESSHVNVQQGNVISTPPTNGTILEGITRKSIMDIARDLGYQVEERSIPIQELLSADEVFCTGTAVGVAPVGSITHKGNRVEYKMSTELGCLKLHSTLVGIQRGEIEDSRGWITATPPHKSQIGVRFLGGQAASPLQESVVEEEMEWENLGFGLEQTDYMYVMKCGEEDDEFEAGQLSRFGNIELNPAAGVLNYGQGVFEGTKAYRSGNGGLFLFRPRENAIRMQIGADRMCMQSPSVDQFIHAVKQTALANRRFVLKAMKRAKDKGFSDVLYLDANNKRDIEEVSASNVFMLKDNVISTPPTNGTILEGITRKSIMDIAQDLGYQVYILSEFGQVEERSIPIEELLEADEVFCTGTAVSLAPVGSITYKGNRVEYKMSTELGCLKLHSRLVGIQRGEIEDSRGWLVQIE
ncbi:hypothetical protein SASPL_137208 [Salvia splendens]|uniref:Branched-chain-amino-acid aminotransferase n=1 Tax=Salvia splendens TaxID=180675 RepID=A0A8X8WRB2_SALSN|nr:hypothetical protein SASPL_137208 [Salvia splendens]